MNPNMEDNRTNKRKIGDIGENIACEFLVKRGFKIMEKNYLRKWGEIDIVAKKGNAIRFVEVKSVSYKGVPLVRGPNVSHGTFDQGVSGKGSDVTHATIRPTKGRHHRIDSQETSYRPEENMHPWKIKRLHRAIQTYLIENKVDSDWQLDLITVKMDMQTRKARVELIENVNI